LKQELLTREGRAAGRTFRRRPLLLTLAAALLLGAGDSFPLFSSSSNEQRDACCVCKSAKVWRQAVRGPRGTHLGRDAGGCWGTAAVWQRGQTRQPLPTREGTALAAHRCLARCYAFLHASQQLAGHTYLLLEGQLLLASRPRIRGLPFQHVRET